MSTGRYYQENSKDFFEGTINADVSDLYGHFLKYIPTGGSILDFGCGSGRDTKAFLDQGFVVEAIDASSEMCKLASAYTGIKVRYMDFNELSDVNKYDGIWACASLLHVANVNLPSILSKTCVALKKTGVIYASFKLGDFEGERDGRYFTDMTEDRFNKLIKSLDGLHLLEKWCSEDARSDRNVSWFNVILGRG